MTRPPSEAVDLTHLISRLPYGIVLGRRWLPYHTADATLCATRRLVT